MEKTKASQQHTTQFPDDIMQLTPSEVKAKMEAEPEFSTTMTKAMNSHLADVIAELARSWLASITNEHLRDEQPVAIRCEIVMPFQVSALLLEPIVGRTKACRVCELYCAEVCTGLANIGNLISQVMTEIVRSSVKGQLLANEILSKIVSEAARPDTEPMH